MKVLSGLTTQVVSGHRLFYNYVYFFLIERFNPSDLSVEVVFCSKGIALKKNLKALFRGCNEIGFNV